MAENLLSILFIDDDEVDVLLLQREFKKNNIFNPLHIANDGIEALDKLRGTNGVQKIVPTPRIILLDLQMPKMNGLEFLKELQDDNELQSVSVFVLMSSHEDKVKVEAYNFNVAGYILKPVTIERFIQAIGTLKNFWRLCFNDELINEEAEKAVPVMHARSLN